MDQKSIAIGLIGIFIGVLGTGFVAGQAVNNNIVGMMRMMGMDSSKVQNVSTHAEMSMSDMTSQLKNKTGDDFDKAFVEMMISHHEGAIAMAELIPTRAKHDELKKLGQDIITAQNAEVSAMKSWQKDWNYTDTEMMREMHGDQ